MRGSDKYAAEPLTPKPHPNFRCSGGDQIAPCHLIFCLISSAPIFLSQAELHFKKHVLLVSLKGKTQNDIETNNRICTFRLRRPAAWLGGTAEAGALNESFK